MKEVTSGESIYSLLSFIGVLTNREEKMKTISAKAVCDTTVVKLPFRAFIPLFAKYPETMIRVIQVDEAYVAYPHLSWRIYLTTFTCSCLEHCAIDL